MDFMSLWKTWGKSIWKRQVLSVVSLSVPRLLFDGWSYQDYMSVLDSEDEMEELGREVLEVAKVLYLYAVSTSCRNDHFYRTFSDWEIRGVSFCQSNRKFPVKSLTVCHVLYFISVTYLLCHQTIIHVCWLICSDEADWISSPDCDFAPQAEGFDGYTLELWSQLGGNKRQWVRVCVGTVD